MSSFIPALYAFGSLTKATDGQRKNGLFSQHNDTLVKIILYSLDYNMPYFIIQSDLLHQFRQ